LAEDNPETNFCLVGKDIYILDSMAFFVSLSGLKYQMAILNSKTIFFYVNKIVHQYGFSGFRLSNQYVEIMPIPPITSSNQPISIQIEALVDKIISIKKQNPLTDTSELEREIDRLVYQLYGLTDEEIRIVEGQR
jgi:type II restriction/modification system DNA methylase subunit YeeA